MCVTLEVFSALCFLFIGYAMTRKLPHRKFEWMTSLELNHLKDHILDLSPEDSTQYIVECDLHVPRHLMKELAEMPPGIYHF